MRSRLKRWLSLLYLDAAFPTDGERRMRLHCVIS